MTTKPDCSAIEQANTQLDERIISFDSELDEMRNLLRSLYPDDPQRPDVLRKLDDLARQHDELAEELRKGVIALQKCLQSTTE